MQSFQERRFANATLTLHGWRSFFLSLTKCLKNDLYRIFRERALWTSVQKDGQPDQRDDQRLGHSVGVYWRGDFA